MCRGLDFAFGRRGGVFVVAAVPKLAVAGGVNKFGTESSLISSQ